MVIFVFISCPITSLSMLWKSNSLSIMEIICIVFTSLTVRTLLNLMFLDKNLFFPSIELLIVCFCNPFYPYNVHCVYFDLIEHLLLDFIVIGIVGEQPLSQFVIPTSFITNLGYPFETEAKN